MKLYEIDQRIEEMFDQVDPETGELSDEAYEALADLAMARAEKIENLGLYIKTLRAESEAIKAEKLALADRQAAKERKANRLTDWLDFICAGEKFETPRLTIGYRKSTAVEITDADQIPEFYREPQPDKVLKTEIKKALSRGEDVPGAVLDYRNNILIK